MADTMALYDYPTVDMRGVWSGDEYDEYVRELVAELEEEYEYEGCWPRTILFVWQLQFLRRIYRAPDAFISVGIRELRAWFDDFGIPKSRHPEAHAEWILWARTHKVPFGI